MSNVMPSQDRIHALASTLKVMKPNKLKDDANTKQLLRFESLFDSPEYVAEDKVDGCHYFTVACRFFSTEHVEKTDNFPHLRDFFISLGMPNLILDGEVNYPGKTSQYCTRVTGADPSTAVAFQQKNGPIHYTIWDMLRTPKGTWMHNVPLKERRKTLEYFYNHYIKGTPMESYIHLTQWVTDNKRAFRDKIIEDGGEGCVIKSLNSLYVMGKNPMWQWMKYKVSDEADMFISGFKDPKVDYGGTDYAGWPYWKDINGVSRPVSKYYYFGWIGAIEFSAYVDGVPTVIGTVSGFDEETRKEISDNPRMYLNKVIKISYMERTEAGVPRHPRWEGFHESKLPTECTWEFN